jgi:hypothetical protein
MVNGRRVSEVVGKIGAHRLKHFGQQGRGGVVVEINSVHVLYFTLTRADFGLHAFGSIEKTLENIF